MPKGGIIWGGNYTAFYGTFIFEVFNFALPSWIQKVTFHIFCVCIKCLKGVEAFIIFQYKSYNNKIMLFFIPKSMLGNILLLKAVYFE